MARGVLILVVGPSGVGKDTLIDAARAKLAAGGQFYFPTRAITRPQDAGGEAHEAITLEAFDAEDARGGFMLSWRAHGLAYGVRADCAEALCVGRHVVLNASRAVIDAARTRYQPMRVISVSASEAALRKRIAARGRESGAEIEERIARAAAFAVSGGDVIQVVNDATLDEGAAGFLRALEIAAGAA
jgi:phosphonate metabolism protein PhnN/1,5-bisphosphokinase (PRPP-forming)